MLALSMETPSPRPPSGHALSLERALKDERRLLEDLLGVLVRQRSAVAGDDIALVDDSVFAAQRILLTLAEARRRRRALLDLLVGEETLPLGRLEGALGLDMTQDLASARDGLQETAQRVAEELERNRRILSGAIHSGDRLIRALTGAPAGPMTYGVTGRADAPSGSALMDRQV